ncbi:MAG: hypothetical protein AB7P34_08440 [Vicinamibacterales bacterium]
MASRQLVIRGWLKPVAFALAIAAAWTPATVTAQRAERAGAGEARRFYPDDPLWRDDDQRDIPPVAKLELSQSYDFLENTFGKGARSIGPALNVNTLGEVPDSSWFTNRLGVRDMTIDEVLRGPDTGGGPAPGPWEVIGRPGSGITPKFTIRDTRGAVFIIKLDPDAIPELPSSVELIATKIFHAIGYHVPEDFIAALDPRQLRVAPGITLKTGGGKRRPLRLEDVQVWLKRQPRRPDGTIRVLASRFVPGKVVGSFRFTGTRPDDANDIYPHERRRELRGLRVFAAWLNHDDARSLNSLDAYVEEGGRRYIRHYLQDFGSTLGSGSISAQQPRAGNEYRVESDKLVKGLLSLGLWQRPWMRVDYADLPSLGNIEADVFEPGAWKPEYPHPAFDQMDAADAFWAARIVSRFTDGMIRSLVEIGRLSDPDAERHLADVIIRRRDKVVAHWITATNPLDQFEVRQSAHGPVLTFRNAAARAGVAAPDSGYRVQWSMLNNTTGTESVVGDAGAAGEPVIPVLEQAFGPADAAGDRYAVASIGTLHRDHRHWLQPVRVTLRLRDDRIDVAGLERPVMRAASETRLPIGAVR